MAKFHIKTRGIVQEILDNKSYLVELLDDRTIITARLSSKTRAALLHDITVGEVVLIVRTPYDPSVGRITGRNWQSPPLDTQV